MMPRDSISPSSSVDPVNLASGVASSIATPQPVTSLNPLGSGPDVPPSGRHHRFFGHSATIIAGVITLLIFLAIAAFVVLTQGRGSDDPASSASSYKVTSLSLGEFARNGELSLDKSQQLQINGQLRINDSAVITPGEQPAAPIVGQLYLSQADRQLYYYNGTSFINLADNSQRVNSIGGLSGDIAVGSGLSVAGGVLSSTAPTSAVLSVQGQTGALSFSAGGGIAINGLTIANTGVTALSGSPGQISVNQSTGNIVLSLPQSIAPSSSPTFNGLNLGTALAVASGGTGVNSLTANGVLLGNGSGPISTVAAAGPGLCLVSTATAPVFGSCSGTASVTSLNGVSGALDIANATAVGTTITIDDATTTTKGIASFSATDFLLAGGAVSLNVVPIAKGGTNAATASGARTNLGAAASGLNSDITSLTGLTAITPGAALAIGSTSQSLTLQGNAATSLSARSGAFTTTFNFIPPTANRTISLPNDSGTVCLSTNNCGYATTGSGVTSVEGLVGALTINNSSGVGTAITIDNATTLAKGIASFSATDFSVTAGAVSLGTVSLLKGGTGATTALGARTNLGAAELGANADITSLTALTSINPSAALTVGSTSQSLTLQGFASTTTLSGTSGVNSTTLSFDAPTGVNSIVIPDASGLVAVSASGAISLNALGDITCLTCLTSDGSGGGSGVTDVNGITNSVTVLAGSGINIVNDVPGGTITIESAGGGVASVNGISGIITLNNSSAINATTITIDDASTSAKGIAQFDSADFSVTGGVVSLGAGITTQGNTFNGDGELVQLDASGGAAIAPGECLMSTVTGAAFGSCPGSSGLSSGTSQTAGNLVKFDTITNTLTDSIASESGAVLTVAGTLAADAIVGDGSDLTVGTSGETLILQGSDNSTFSVTNGSFSTTLGFATPTANQSITLPDDSGEVCLDSGNCLSAVAGVQSVNLATGALTLAGTADQVSVGTVGTTITLSLPQNLATGSTPTFASATLGFLTTNTIAPTSSLTIGSTSNGVSVQGTSISLNSYSGLFSSNLIFQSAAGNATIVIPNQSGTVAVSASGNIALSNAGNITFTGTLPVASGGTGVTSFTANGILYGNGSGPVSVTTPGSAGQCLISNGPSSNPTFQGCASGTVTSSGATANFIPLFSNSQNITNSILSQDGGATTLTVNGIATITGALNVEAGIDTDNTNINAGTGTITGVGSGLSGLNASNLSTGTVNNSVLSSSVALLTRNSQVFAGNDQLFRNTSDSTTAFQIQDQDNNPLFIADTSNMTVTVAQLAVSGNLTVNGHLITGGGSPTGTAAAAAGTTGACVVSGTDTAGTIQITPGGTGISSGDQCSVTLNTAFGAAPKIVFSPTNTVSANMSAHMSATTTTLNVTFNSAPASGQLYEFNYFAPQ